MDIAFHNAVKKYGYNNFKRTTIKIFDNEKEAYDFEKLVITPTLLKSK
nr:MAG TPA: GIY-YIG nuclease superfamily protein [Caudoviricetes sp.]